MYYTVPIIVSKASNKALFDYFKTNALLAKNLKNAVLYRLRQSYTAMYKETLSDNEKEVLDEMELVRSRGYKIGKRLSSYYEMDRIFRETHNPDYFSGLPMQSANQCVKDVIEQFKSFVSLTNKWYKNPSSLLGKPNMPHYIKSNVTTYTITNQDGILYPVYENDIFKGFFLKLPKTKERLFISHLAKDTILKEIQIKPYFDTFKVLLVCFNNDEAFVNEAKYSAAIDFGVENIVTLVDNDNLCLIYKGTALKAQNQYYNKQKAKLTSIITKGHTNKQHVTSKQLQRLSKKRDLFLKDQMHKISKDIITQCIKNNVGTLYLGSNKQWKQNSNIGQVNNQNFVGIPLNTLKNMIKYKAIRVGIKVMDVEESYTSKADFLSNDFIPTYGVNDKEVLFHGKRNKRGLYQSGTNQLINADVNGAANILRKHNPEAFHSGSDYAYLLHPSVIDFKALNFKM